MAAGLVLPAIGAEGAAVGDVARDASASKAETPLSETAGAATGAAGAAGASDTDATGAAGVAAGAGSAACAVDTANTPLTSATAVIRHIPLPFASRSEGDAADGARRLNPR